MTLIDSSRALANALEELGRALELRSAPDIQIVVCGGASLVGTNLVSRATRDIDILALRNSEGRLCDPEPLPKVLVEAAADVGAILGFSQDWVNNGPSRGEGGLFRMGLPDGLGERLHARSFGSRLTVCFIGRIDQIHFKLYAAVDRGGYHITDLLALNPAESELESAARWSMTHDVSDGYRHALVRLLEELRFGNVAAQLQK